MEYLIKQTNYILRLHQFHDKIATEKEMFTNLKYKTKEFGLSTNVYKTNVLITRRYRTDKNLNVNNDIIKIVDNFIYLTVNI